MKKILSLMLVLLLAMSLFGCGEEKEFMQNSHNDPEADTKGYTMDELMEAMGLGWNLGNTFDAPEGETSWGAPVTTKEMIDTIHELGFNTMRLPVSWGQHTSGAPDYIIDEDYMKRVEEVANYALDNDMFVILNSHHDNDFYYPSRAHEEKSINYIEKIWTQIAEHFKDYDQHLIFQPMNEPRLTGTNYEWWIDYKNQDCLDALEIVSELNQKCLDVVRASGGRNVDRFILVAAYAGSPYYSLEEPYKLPDDTVEGKLIMSVHGYNPYNLAMNDDTSYRNFDQSCKNDINDFMTKHYEKYRKNGVGVIIDEMGIINKNNPYDRQDWAAYYVAKAKSLGMVCVWWDNHYEGIGNESYGLFDRDNLCIYDSSKAPYDGMIIGFNTPLDEIKPSKPE